MMGLLVEHLIGHKNDKKNHERLVKEHEGLVVSIAKRYMSSRQSIDDLIQEGMIGLLVAADRFDPKRGVKFGTYATWWIRSHITAYAFRQRGPAFMGGGRPEKTVFSGLGRARRAIHSSGDKDLDEKAMADYLGVSPEAFARVAAHLSFTECSLDAPRHADDDRKMLLPADEPSPEEAFGDFEEAFWRERRFRKALSTLTEKEQIVIEGRHLREKPLMLAELATQLGMTKQGVSVIEARAIRKLRVVVKRG